MTVKEFATYTLICDEPGCEADFVEEWSSGDYSGYASLDDIDLSDCDWVKRGEQHFCGEHAELHDPTAEEADAERQAADPTALPPAMFDVIEETP